MYGLEYVHSADGFFDSLVGDAIDVGFVTIDREDVLEEIYEQFADDLGKIEN